MDLGGSDAGADALSLAGNVRELRIFASRMPVLCPHETSHPMALAPLLTAANAASGACPSFGAHPDSHPATTRCMFRRDRSADAR